MSEDLHKCFIFFHAAVIEQLESKYEAQMAMAQQATTANKS